MEYTNPSKSDDSFVDRPLPEKLKENEPSNNSVIDLEKIKKEYELRMTVQGSRFSGPIPPPEVLKAYDLVEPGLAREIFEMAKAQQKHRMQMERTVINGDNGRAWWGLILGFVIACLFLGSSTYLIRSGHDLAGGTLAGTTLVSLSGAFIYGSNQRRNERREKQDELLKRLPDSDK